ncbi:hypothetical protein [Streptomyces sp. NPDC005408]|uniref:LexA family protein n=1 Tax=Streptomyces sp. NPDC005408 TaxID=3155341 RepID=UPI0033A6A235
MTERQETILRCIREYIIDTGGGPSILQIGKLVGVSSPSSSPISSAGYVQGGKGADSAGAVSAATRATLLGVRRSEGLTR